MGEIGTWIGHLGIMPNVTNKNTMNPNSWVGLGPGLDIWA